MPAAPRKRTAAKKTAAAPEPPAPIRTPRFPERKCRDMVGGEFVAHTCDVVEYHQGPCASYSVPASLERRRAWEKANPDKIDPMPVEEWVGK